MTDKSLSEVYDSGQTRLSNTDNLRERTLAGIITVFIISGLILTGSPAAAVSTSLSGPTDNVDLNNNDPVTLKYNVEIESGERIQIDGYEFEITDNDGDTTTIEATGSNPENSDLSASGNSDAIDISDGDLSISTDFSGVRSSQPGYGYGYGNLRGYDYAAGYDAYAGYGYGYGYSASGDSTISVTLTIAGDAFNTGDYDAVAQVQTSSDGSTAFGDNSETFTVEDTSSDPPSTDPSPGPSLSPGPSDDDEETEDQQENQQTQGPTVEEVRQELDQTEPNTQTTSAIVDSDPDSPGVNVQPDGTESVREITFSDESASGAVDITEWQDPPESVSESVTGAVSAAANEQTSDQTDVSASVVTVADIDPDSDEVRNSPATVTMTVERNRLDNPENAVIVHERDNSWEELETSVEETSDGEVTLVAETDSFSLFAVAEVTESVQTDTGQSEESTDDGTDESSDDGPGTTALVGLLVIVLLVVAGAVGYRQMQ